MRYRMPTGTWWDLSDGIVSTDKVKKKKGNRMKKYRVKKKNGIMGRLLTALLLVILLGTVLLCSGCKTAVQPKTSEATNVQTDSGEKVSLSVWAFFDENTPGTYYVDLWEKLAEEYEGKAVIGKLDVEESMDIAGRYGVMNVPTLILFKDGRAVERKVGLQSASDLRKLLDSVL